MKNRLTILILLFALTSIAQSFSDGVYTSTFGTITLTFEQGIEYPNAGIVYGDYKGIGTICGSTTNVGKEISGNFHNGAAEGKFIFFSPIGKQNFFDSGITSFNGNWGYDTDNKNSQNNDFKWNVTAKTGGLSAIKNEVNVWSGKWNTNHGYIILQQVGNKITGKYNDVGTINATYNRATKKLNGTFTNKGKTGYLEFNFEGNSFKGKWGWAPAMTDGNWTGEKHVKNNKIVTTSTNTANQTTSTTTNTTTNTTGKKSTYRFHLSDFSGGEYSALRNPELYGFVGIQLFRVTNNERVKINSFGNKSEYYFNRNENQAFATDSKFDISETPDYYRDFEISDSDLNNPNVDIEVVVFHHFKGKVTGTNYDWEKVSQTFILERCLQLNRLFVGKACENGVCKENYLTPSSKSIVMIKTKKL